MDPISSTSGAVHRTPDRPAAAAVAEPQAAPLPSSPLPPAARLADRPAPVREVETPPLPATVQREALTPPDPPVMTREQMVALLQAAVGGVPLPTPRS